MTDRRQAIVWSSNARADLVELWNYYERVATAATANKVVRAIGEACRLIEEHPFAGRMRDEVRRGLRSVGARPYVIFYRMQDDGPEIVRILHGRRDINQIFREPPERDP